MPYIKSEDYSRALIAPEIPGELNYVMTKASISFMLSEIDGPEFEEEIRELVGTYMVRNGISYTNYNNVIGALHCCGFELVRRAKGINTDTPDKAFPYSAAALYCQFIMARIAYDLYHEKTVPYEDTKIAENGDVFPKEIIGD